jgi:hypothetical protein
MTSYGLSDMVLDFAHVIQSRPSGIFSHRPLGNSQNLDLWAMSEMESLYDGIATVHGLFYDEYSRETIARLILCVSMQESTGDHALHVPAGRSQGLMQVSPESVVADFDTYGQTLPSLREPLTPGRVNVSDPGTSVKLWGWYGNAAAHTGVSVAEYVHRVEWQIAAHRLRPTLAHALLAWLAGPSADVGQAATKAHFEEYLNRIQDYWIAAGFGSQRRLQLLLKRRLRGNVTYVTDWREPFVDSIIDAVKLPPKRQRGLQ